MSLILLVIFIALVFTYINGFHDTANSIATVVSTKVLTPRQAIVLAAVTNLGGAFVGSAVATTIASGLVDAQIATMPVNCCALLAAIAWNLLTWWSGLPSSSSHALIGGLCGAVLAASGSWSSIIWSIPGKNHWWEGKGVLWKVVFPMITSPLVGFIGGFHYDEHFVLPAPELAAGGRQPRLRQITIVQRRLHGFRARHERRAKDHGHHRPRPGRGHGSRLEV